VLSEGLGYTGYGIRRLVSLHTTTSKITRATVLKWRTPPRSLHADKYEGREKRVADFKTVLLDPAGKSKKGKKEVRKII
jgi:hypothetical protein